MKILVGCEESQAVTIELRKLGHEAYSCDTQECSGGYPEWHLQQDVTDLLKQKWDMIIAFPPCTFISNAGACRLYPKKGELNQDRFEKGLEAKKFFMQFYDADCEKIVIENPVPSKIYELPERSQIIQPYEHGHNYSKKTCLWIKGLPLLKPTDLVEPTLGSWVSGGSRDSKGNRRKNLGTTHRSSLMRSKTFPGIAKAMAEQWAGKIN